MIATGPAAEIIRRSGDIDLRQFPVPAFFELDSGPFITAAIGVENRTCKAHVAVSVIGRREASDPR